MNGKELEKMLKEALDMEEKGYKFYKDTSKKAENDITKKTFSFLADQEVLHIDSIKNFYSTLKEKQEFPSIDLSDVKKERNDSMTIFSKRIKELNEKIKPSDDDKKACEFAMEFENNGYKYYESMLKNAKDENLVKLLKFLLNEESKHYKGIEDVYTYLTDSTNWFMYEEGTFPQGG